MPYRLPQSGPYTGCVVNSDTGRPVIVESGRLTGADFENVSWQRSLKSATTNPAVHFTALCGRPIPTRSGAWRPLNSSGDTCPGWFDYAICDEVHQLAGDTAQGNALGTFAACANRIVGLTGTLLGGFADDLFNTLFRLEAGRMKEHGYEWGTTRKKCVHSRLWRSRNHYQSRTRR